MLDCLILTFILFGYFWYKEFQSYHYIDKELEEIKTKSFNRGYIIGIISIIMAMLLILIF